MKTLLSLLAAAITPLASAAIVYIDDNAVNSTTLVDVNGSGTISASGSTLTTPMSGMALFDDTAGGSLRDSGIRSEWAQRGRRQLVGHQRDDSYPGYLPHE